MFPPVLDPVNKKKQKLRHGHPEMSHIYRANTITAFQIHVPIEHGSMLEHVWQHNKDDFRAPQVHLVDFSLDAVGVSNNGVLDVQVHLVFGFKEQASD